MVFLRSSLSRSTRYRRPRNHWHWDLRKSSRPRHRDYLSVVVDWSVACCGVESVKPAFAWSGAEWSFQGWRICITNKRLRRFKNELRRSPDVSPLKIRLLKCVNILFRNCWSSRDGQWWRNRRSDCVFDGKNQSRCRRFWSRLFSSRSTEVLIR